MPTLIIFPTKRKVPTYTHMLQPLIRAIEEDWAAEGRRDQYRAPLLERAHQALGDLYDHFHFGAPR